ncbi:MAG: DUF7832 domain-containing protein [Planctomycetota bacterium]|jgi:hypothetical protein
MITFDKLKWHCDHESFPKGLARERGGIYGAPFLCWAVAKGHLNREYKDELSEELAEFESRRLSPLELYAVLGAVDSEMLTDVGISFACHCFESDEFDYYRWFEDKYCRGLSSPYDFNITHDQVDRLVEDIDLLYREFRRNTEQAPATDGEDAAAEP